MKYTTTNHLLAVLALGASISLLPLCASAQTASPAPADRTTTSATTARDTTAVDYPRERTHYGWIGLLGLAGLLPRTREVVVQERTDVRR